MTADALPVFHRIARMLSSRGDRGLTLEEIRDAAGLAEALVAGQVPDDWRISEFARRLELSDEDVREIMDRGNEHEESAGPAPRRTTITGPGTPQTDLALAPESPADSQARGLRRTGAGGRAR